MVHTYTCRNNTTSTRMSQDDINTCWQQLLDIITTSAHACIGTSIVNAQSQHWWSRDPSIPSLHAQYRAARQHHIRLRQRRAGSVPSHVLAAAAASHVHTRRAFNDAVTHAKRAADDDMTAAIDAASKGGRNKLLRSQHKKINRQPRTPLPSFTSHDGTPQGSMICA